MRISPTALGASSLPRTSGPSDAALHDRPADAEQRDVEPLPEVDDRADAGVGLERAASWRHRRAGRAP